MSELSFEQMLEESFKTIHNGEVVEGTVIDVKPDEIILNIGYKADGIITKSEYSNDQSLDLTTVVSVGDTMTVKVLKVNDGEGQVLLTYKRLAAEKGNERLREAFENHEVLKATVTQILGGGICTTVDEVRVFIPASLVSDSYEKDLSKYEGQEIEFVISEFNPRRNRVIGDRRQLLVAERAEKQNRLDDHTSSARHRHRTLHPLLLPAKTIQCCIKPDPVLLRRHFRHLLSGHRSWNLYPVPVHSRFQIW